MKTLAIVVLVSIILYVVFSTIRQRKLALNKFSFVIIIVSIGIIILSNQFNKASVSSDVPYYQTIAPDVQHAPYILQTPSRAYYVATYTDNKDSLTLTNFYYYDKAKWQRANEPLYFDKAISEFSKLEIQKRKIGG